MRPRHQRYRTGSRKARRYAKMQSQRVTEKQQKLNVETEASEMGHQQTGLGGCMEMGRYKINRGMGTTTGKTASPSSAGSVLFLSGTWQCFFSQPGRHTHFLFWHVYSLGMRRDLAQPKVREDKQIDRTVCLSVQSCMTEPDRCFSIRGGTEVWPKCEKVSHNAKSERSHNKI